ncbi:multiheme c-type cytochrome [Opitutus terrae]|nr:multiheme c-type cytochrome [Opitutus terrae]
MSASTPPPDKQPSSTPASASDRGTSPHQQAARGWTAWLTFAVTLGLLVEVVTGLWILVAPFSLATQLVVLLHGAAGVLLVAPFAVYQVRHYQLWSAQTLSVVKLIGYAAMALTITCLVTGVIVTAQALFGRRLSSWADQVHLVTGLASAAVLIIHFALAYVRRREPLRSIPNFRRRLRRRGLALAGMVAGLYAAVGLGAALLPRTSVNLPLPSDYSLPEYAQKFDEYRGSPFAPTYARTSTGGLVNPAVLSGSTSCGTSGCHEQILAEWEPSAHRFSAMNPPFQAVQKAFARDRSPADTRYCAGCHDPISLFAGAKDIHNLSLSAPGMQEGNSCVVCHSISHVDQRGNADYVLTPPTRYLGESASGLAKRVSDFLIRAYPQQHLADYNRNILRTPEFCGACHKQFIPEALNRFGASPSQNQFDEWRKSHWVDPQHADKTLSCRDCHMRLVPDSRDPGAGEAGDLRRASSDGAHRHHGTIATNLFMPDVLKLPHHEEQRRLTTAWIRGETVLPEIAHLWPSGPVSSIELLAPAEAQPGTTLELTAIVKNRKAGHNFITGPLDFLRSWVHLRVMDGNGVLLAEWGGIDPATREILDEPGHIHTPGRPRDAGTLVLEGVPLDEAGQPIVRHELWRKAGGSGNRVIFPGYADKQVYRLNVPAGARGPLTVTADLNFRRYRQEFLNLVVPDMERESGVYQPTITKDSASREIAIQPAATARTALASPHVAAR